MQAFERLNVAVPSSLQRDFSAFAGLCALALAGGFGVLWTAWAPEIAWRWLPLPALNTAYLLVVLWRGLPANHRAGEMQLLPDLGLGNWLSLLRGLMVALMAGFLLLPQPAGWLAWAPGVLYTLSCAADFSDGIAARLTHHTTRLGELLDMSLDGLGVLVACILLVQYGQVPPWYLLVGFARYLFLAGLWLRRRLERPIYELPPSLSRRIFAGLQMGFLAVMLWPLFSPPGTWIAATLFGLPLLAGFVLDWFYVSGILSSPPSSPATSVGASITTVLPLFLRLLVLVLNLGLWVGPGGMQGSGQVESCALCWIGLPMLMLANGVVVVMLALGVLPRVAAGFALGFLGFYQMLAPLNTAQIILAVAYTLILYTGSGPFSLWTPEERLVQRRIGEPASPDPENIP